MIDDATPEELGLDPVQWQRALQLVESLTRENVLPAVGLQIGRHGKASPVYQFGRQRVDDEYGTIDDDAIYLVASITKPIVAMGIMLLVERGLIGLTERVNQFVPEFKGKGFYQVTVRHLLTHTSGLPDMLPDNRELRASHASLTTFLEKTCDATFHFAPGEGVQYQSMGFVLLGEIIKRVTGKTCSQFLQEEFFDPLQMNNTALGATTDWLHAYERESRIAEITLPEEQVGTDWNWNSEYWRQLGAPWGGLLSTPGDLGRFAQLMLSEGEYLQARFLSTATIATATRNQLSSIRKVPEEQRRCRPWGYGWRMNWPDHNAGLCDLVTESAYGHWGATGTLLWIDPQLDFYVVILTTQPDTTQQKQLIRISNAIVAAVCG